MKKIITIVFSFFLVFASTLTTNSFILADDVSLVNEALPVNPLPIPNQYSDIHLSNSFSYLDYGDLVCSLDVSNTSTNTKNRIRVPLYAVGFDQNGNVIETSAAYCDVSPGDSSKIKRFNKLRLKAGFSIKSVEVGIIDSTSSSIIDLYKWGYRRDDQQNKIIVTGCVKDNIPYPYDTNTQEIKQNGGFVAVGYDKNDKIVEVHGATDNIPNGSCKNFEVTFLAGSLIDHIKVVPSGDEKDAVNNIWGSRVEKGKTIITGNIENNPYSQYIQVVTKGYSKNATVDVDGQTLAIDKNANADYRFEMDQSNNIDNVDVTMTQHEDISTKGSLVTYSTHRENGKINIDALVSSGYYKEKNLGIIATGLDSKGQPIETNTATVKFQANKCQLQHVQTTLNAGDRINDINVTLAGNLEDEIQLRKCAYRIENGQFLVTSIIENGNTIDQTAGVQVIGYDKNGKKVEVNGYSDKLAANSTKQYTTILNDSKDITKINAQLVGIVKGKVQEDHAYFKDANTFKVSGLLLNGSGKHNAGLIAMGLDSKGHIVDADCAYNSLNDDSINPIMLTLNDARRISSINTSLVNEGYLSSGVVLNGSGFYFTNGNIQINGVITNGTTLTQNIQLLSIGYNSKGKITDMALTSTQQLKPSSVNKVSNTIPDAYEKIKNVKTILYGTPCKTSIAYQCSQLQPNSTTSYKYTGCIQNGASDQDFTIKTFMYDLKGKVMGQPSFQTVHIAKYSAQTFNTYFDTLSTSKVVVLVYDSSRKLLQNSLYKNGVIYSKPVKTVKPKKSK